jgi:hypothetical protein
VNLALLLQEADCVAMAAPGHLPGRTCFARYTTAISKRPSLFHSFWSLFWQQHALPTAKATLVLRHATKPSSLAPLSSARHIVIAILRLWQAGKYSVSSLVSICSTFFNYMRLSCSRSSSHKAHRSTSLYLALTPI